MCASELLVRYVVSRTRVSALWWADYEVETVCLYDLKHVLLNHQLTWDKIISIAPMLLSLTQDYGSCQNVAQQHMRKQEHLLENTTSEY